jgi:hypothetical protein
MVEVLAQNRRLLMQAVLTQFLLGATAICIVASLISVRIASALHFSYNISTPGQKDLFFVSQVTRAGHECKTVPVMSIVLSTPEFREKSQNSGFLLKSSRNLPNFDYFSGKFCIPIKKRF